MKIKKMTDEECLAKFIEFLEDRIEINTKFIVDDDGNITHQFLVINCGEYVTVSSPQALEVTLRPAMAQELGGILIN